MSSLTTVAIVTTVYGVTNLFHIVQENFMLWLAMVARQHKSKVTTLSSLLHTYQHAIGSKSINPTQISLLTCNCTLRDTSNKPFHQMYSLPYPPIS